MQSKRSTQIDCVWSFAKLYLDVARVEYRDKILLYED